MGNKDPDTVMSLDSDQYKPDPKQRQTLLPSFDEVLGLICCNVTEKGLKKWYEKDLRRKTYNFKDLIANEKRAIL